MRGEVETFTLFVFRHTQTDDDIHQFEGDDGDDAGSVPAYRPGAFVSGDTVVIQCTAALVAQVERDGGADGFRETHDEVGRLALCTEEEAEA